MAVGAALKNKLKGIIKNNLNNFSTQYDADIQKSEQDTHDY